VSRQTTRRGFFKFLGAGSVVGAVAGLGAPISRAETKDKTALRYVCYCGNQIVAEVPEKAGSVVHVDCSCGKKWDMEWMGDYFKTRCSQ
jgi:hypothetical protein